ncbi:MAG: YggS family pyridoxal phosphate-dependent enzyme [Bdellovibrionales bacterium]|nr:YggS family pyridoxal phosphate-dependent enzyme [Bdellovibrionales bacterium]
MAGLSLADNWINLNQKIQIAAEMSGRSIEDILFIGISKFQSHDKIEALYHLGCKAFGESYVPELVTKQVALSGLDIQWHFVGRLQTNKVKKVVGTVDLIHSVDRLSLGEEIDKRAAHISTVQPILVQVNIHEEESKAGVHIEKVPKLLEQLQRLPHIRIQGLMSMPPLFATESESRQSFAKVRELLMTWKDYLDPMHPFDQLSMGTSHDYEAAILEGATMIRLGTVLFGERPSR